MENENRKELTPEEMDGITGGAGEGGTDVCPGSPNGEHRFIPRRAVEGEICIYCRQLKWPGYEENEHNRKYDTF